MSLSYSIINFTPGECPICLDIFNPNFPIVAHERDDKQEGTLHPVHFTCLREWVQDNPGKDSCIICRNLVNYNKIFPELSCLDQVIEKIKRAAQAIKEATLFLVRTSLTALAILLDDEANIYIA
jgi:E3 ubiquitin-protein ligase DOA10